MANRTVKDAHTIHGTNPQYLIEKIIRTRIYDNKFWKEECFGLTAELLVDKAMALDYIGGIYGGNIRATPFLCLILKMLQIQPSKDIIVEFIKRPDFKYVRAIGAYYLRLTGTSVDIYKYLEPLYVDYRKMKRMDRNGKYQLIHMDEFIDELFQLNRVCDVVLPHLQHRAVLEANEILQPKHSALDEDHHDANSTGSDSDNDSITGTDCNDIHRQHHSTSNNDGIGTREVDRHDQTERRRGISTPKSYNNNSSPKRTKHRSSRSPSPHKSSTRRYKDRKSPSRRSKSRSRSRTPRKYISSREHHSHSSSGRANKEKESKRRRDKYSHHTTSNKDNSIDNEDSLMAYIGKYSKEELEDIKIQNVQRAKLGLKPLKL